MITRRAFCAAALAARAVAATPAFARVSRCDSRYLELTDGTAFIPIGLNLIAPPSNAKATEAESFERYTAWLDKLSANGGNFIRVWLSQPFWAVEHERAGQYDEAKARRIEKMLGLAAARGIRVKLTMEHFRSIGGGRQPWADQPLHHTDRGGTAKSMPEWVASEESRAQFRKKIEWYAQRFGSRPEIFGWELWNEMDAVQSGSDFLGWTEAMLPALHRAFPQNLCMQSLGSFDHERKIPVYERHSKIPGNDLAQVHRYLDLGADWKVCHGPVDIAAAEAVRSLLGFATARPVMLAEGGAVEPRHTGPFRLYQKDRDGIILHDVLFAPFFAGAAACGQIWHWDAYVDANNLWWHFSRFAEVVKGLDPAAQQFQPAMLTHDRCRIYTLRGRRLSLYWIRDSRADWKSELEDGKPPEAVEGMTLPLPPGKRPKARTYDPWTGRWAEAPIDSTGLRLPTFRRSIVVKLESA